MMVRGDIYFIDPTHLNDEDSLVFGYFVQCYFEKQRGGKLEAEKDYPYPELTEDMKSIFQQKNIKIPENISLTQSVYWRYTSDGLEKRGEVFGSSLSHRGTFKHGFERSGLLRLTGQVVSQKPTQNERLILEYHRLPPHYQDELKRSQYALHLHFKQPIVGHPIIVMRHFPGVELREIIDQDREGSIHLSLDLRLELSIILLQTWEKEVYDNNLVHGDIKPQNIIVLLDLERQRVVSCHYVDFDYAKKQTNTNTLATGSMPYIAPETLQKRELTPLSNTFSLGRVLASLWGAQLPPIVLVQQVSPDNTIKKLLWDQEEKREATLSDYCNITELFSSVEDIDDDDDIKDEIETIINSMLAMCPDKRSSVFGTRERLERFIVHGERRVLKEIIYGAHEFLEDIRLPRTLETLPEEMHPTIIAANLHALTVNQAMHNAIRLALCEHQHNIDKIYAGVILLIKNMSVDTPEAIKEFVTVLGIPAFQQARSKQEILKILQDITVSYQTHLRQLQILRKRAELLKKDYQYHTQLMDLLEGLIVGIEIRLKNNDTHHHGIDNLILFDKQFKKMLERGYAQLKEIDRLIQEEKTKHRMSNSEDSDVLYPSKKQHSGIDWLGIFPTKDKDNREDEERRLDRGMEKK
ncbi:MAG TPA: hypothetical protein VJN02_07150 [Gammaproteobacteria bacterium]|nr:hypothetical protein [Gammaproteobacteria bacterium]